MLGKAVAEHWRRRQKAVLAIDREHADITDREGLCAWADAFHPELIVNCAAFTAVDRCESEPDAAFAINGDAVANVVAAADRVGAGLIHLSSDYVFDGTAGVPYREDAATAPLSVYGKSKLRGEEEALRYPRALVVRASWLFGPGGPNFVTTIRRLLSEGHSPLRVVDDQKGCPTYTPFLARALWDLVATGMRGSVHYCNRDAVSGHGFATEIAGSLSPGTPVLPVTSAEFPRPALRPAYSVLDSKQFEIAVGRRVEPWLAGLTAYLSQGEP